MARRLKPSQLKRIKDMGQKINHADSKPVFDAQAVLHDYYGSAPITLPVDILGIAKKHGISVIRSGFSGDHANDLFGFIEKEGDSIRIVLNDSNAPTRRRFTAAHELAHYFLHHTGADLQFLDMRSTVQNHRESQANKFAAELLMPEDMVRAEYDALLFPTTQQLAKKFGVSEQAMAIRLRNLQLDSGLGAKYE